MTTKPSHSEVCQGARSGELSDRVEKEVRGVLQEVGRCMGIMRDGSYLSERLDAAEKCQKAIDEIRNPKRREFFQQQYNNLLSNGVFYRR